MERDHDYMTTEPWLDIGRVVSEPVGWYADLGGKWLLTTNEEYLTEFVQINGAVREWRFRGMILARRVRGGTVGP